MLIKRFLPLTVLMLLSTEIIPAQIVRSYSVADPYLSEFLDPINSESIPQISTGVSINNAMGFTVNFDQSLVKNLGEWSLSDAQMHNNRASLDAGPTGGVTDCGDALGEQLASETPYWFQSRTSDGQSNATFVKSNKNIYCKMIQEGTPSANNSDIVAMIPTSLVFSITNYSGPDVVVTANTTSYNSCIINLDSSNNPRDIPGSCPMVLNADGSVPNFLPDNGIPLTMATGSLTYILQKPIYFPVYNNGAANESLFDKVGGGSVVSETGIDHEIILNIDNLNYYY